MQKFMILPLLGILVGVTSCECNGPPFAVAVHPYNPAQVITYEAFIINQPTSVEITVPSGYITSCSLPNTAVQSVTFYNGDIKLGEDNTAPFSMNWVMTPGQEGIPLTGSMKVQVKAKALSGRYAYPFEFTVQVNPPTP